MLTREQKKQLVKQLAETLKNVKGVVLSEFQGLPTRDLQALRRQLRKEKVEYKVIKLTLLKKIFQQAGIDASKLDFQVPLSISFSAEDEIAPAKILNEFAKTHEKIKVLAGVLNHKFIEAAEVKKLAALPGKKELRGQVLRAIVYPLSGLVEVLSGNLRGLIYVLSAIKNSKS